MIFFYENIKIIKKNININLIFKKNKTRFIKYFKNNSTSLPNMDKD
jgi:hypothetical protein